MNCHIQEICFHGEDGLAGYSFRFELPLDRVISLNVPTFTGEKKAHISNFQFRYNRLTSSFMGEYVEDFKSSDVTASYS